MPRDCTTVTVTQSLHFADVTRADFLRAMRPVWLEVMPIAPLSPQQREEVEAWLARRSMQPVRWATPSPDSVP